MTKHAEKKDVDLLLRNLAKSNRAGADKTVDDSTSDHLDTDELSSYAEDVLPSATRARYTNHIADCASCRKMVANLAIAAGATVRSRDEAATTKSSFWQRLRELFSPAVLRYAIPAIALLAVMGVAFVSLRRDNNYVARNEPPASSTSAVREESQNKTSKVPENNQAGSENGSLTQPTPKPGSTDGNASSHIAATEESGARKRNDEQSSDTVAATRPSYAPEPAAPHPQQPEERAGETESSANAREQQGKKDTDNLARDEGRAGAKVERSNAPAAEPKSKNSPFVGGIAAQRSVANLEDKKAPEKEISKTAKGRAGKETRSVAGRTFYREENMWIDIAFNSSQAVTIVRRGSEQYRALVADEPGLKSIDDALGGPFIVVWKGRAYRIQ